MSLFDDIRESFRRFSSFFQSPYIPNVIENAPNLLEECTSRITLNDPDATRDFAAKFVKTLQAPCILALFGDLGAGKTTFMQGLVRGLGGSENMVQSPTFVYLHHYPTATPVFHFDLYRLRSAKDFLGLGFDEYFEKNGITAIEWPERIAEILPASTIRIHITASSETLRHLVIE